MAQKNGPPTIVEPVEIDPKIVNIFVFLAPAVILLIGAAAYFIILPNMYGKAISLNDWLFTNPQDIIEALRDADAMTGRVNSMVGMRILGWVWQAALIASLFFVGRQLQAKPEPNAADAILTKKQPYFQVQDIRGVLTQTKARHSSKKLDELLYAIKMLEEKLAVESDFGIGKSDVITCEKQIAKQLQFLFDTSRYVSAHTENRDVDEKLDAMQAAVRNVNFLLRRRMEMKRK